MRKEEYLVEGIHEALRNSSYLFTFMKKRIKPHLEKNGFGFR